MIFLSAFEIQEEVIYLAIAVLVIIFLVVRSNFTSLQKKSIDDENKLIGKDVRIREQELEFQAFRAEATLKSQEWALVELEKFKVNELTNLKKGLEENAINAAALLLEEWKVKNELGIRQDAINRSYTTNLGKITEHLIPFHANFKFNPKDARFIGSPIDLIVFDGVTDERPVVEIHFIEVKTGTSQLSATQRKIKSAVVNKRIEWLEINPATL
jgi:predicted Holliday junction resolvase-like endonuclease